MRRIFFPPSNVSITSKQKIIQYNFVINLNCRSLRYGHSIRSHAHNTKNAAPSELPLPQTSTLRSRRRLARLLVAGSFVFVFCWSPYVIFLICTRWSARETYSKTVASYSLFFGKYFHFPLKLNYIGFGEKDDFLS